ncbi:PREDICTED: elongation factor-like GTPase 1 [Nicrophorus vespilloides]|uniref:Elongation factor-like GTPase 1 n=1 Tax=Nicrophorus vespilloides TaxID=110193 RepID=A0ABM1MCU3_NICVS|nr:PREDICTED: elongation factor-like GTPase 1 [Nicrophorus vespilloides]
MTETANQGSRPDFIRNICILAHVDHGKTTIADSLVASNGHISKRIAGNVRYLDDRKDEQERGITMKSSAISLSYTNENKENMVINLIDTPGHIDFSTEVSAAIRICDGALIVVDIIEGVCVQTREALKQAFEEKIKMILIINKVDRMIVDLLKPIDVIFQSILHIIEDCNAYISELCKYDVQSDVNEENYMFSPVLGNVIFASAIDGWGVTTKQVASMFLNVFPDEDADSLNKKMWDFDFYVSKGKLVTGAIGKKKPNIFITLFLNTIHYVYFTLRIRLDRAKYNTIVTKLNIKKETSEMKHTDSKIQVKAILQAWKPLAMTIFQQVNEFIPPPTKVDPQRFNYLINSTQYFGNTEMISYTEKMIDNFKRCAEPEIPTVVYVSKMFAASKRMLNQEKAINIVTGKRDRNEIINEMKLDEMAEKEEEKEDSKNEEDLSEDEENYDKTNDSTHLYGVLALARVFSGVLRTGQEIYILSSKYRPPGKDVDGEEYAEHCEFIQKVKIKQLYVLLGRELTAVASVSAGNICGILGLEKFIARTGTLCSTLYALPLTERITLEPIVRTSIECHNPKELPLLRKGLKFLKKIDSCVQVAMQDSGELVLVTAGDVHLAKCIEDIQNMVAKIDINVSKPMVSIKETIISLSKRVDHTKTSPFTIEMNLKDIGLILNATIVPLPENIVQAICSNFELLKLIEEFQCKSGIDLILQYDNGGDLPVSSEKIYSNEILMQRVKEQLKSAFESCKFGDMWKKVWSIGKKRDYINLLINNTSDYKRNIFATMDEADVRACLDHCIINGFDMWCRAGPICEEPISHCAVIINDYQLNNYDALKGMDLKATVIAGIPVSVKDCFRESFKKQTQRLMEPIFMTDIQVNTRILGKVYSVVSRRHGKVLDAVGMDEVEKTFLVKAQIPVAESHDFANEIRKTTSGQANPNLRFSHYEIIDGDPYFNVDEVESDEEDEDNSYTEAKRASKLRIEIRKRKGLKVDDQVVVHAEKQRTLNKKK